MTAPEQPQPDVQWVFPPQRRRHPGRVILLIVLILVVLAVAAGAVWLVLPKGGEPSATPTTPAPTVSASATRTPSPTPTTPTTASPSPTEAATPGPVVTEEPPTEIPGLAAFRDRVSPLIGDGRTGLGMIDSSDSATSAQIAGDLILDAQNLADQPAPEAIDQPWRDGVAAYLATLTSLQSTANAGGDTASGVAAASTALDALGDLLG